MSRRPLGLLAWGACAIGLGLAAANASVAYQVFGAGGGVDPELAGQALALFATCSWLIVRRSALAGLGVMLASLWVYWGLAPIVGKLATGPPQELSLWIGPLELLAFAFFPLAFLGWRNLVHRDAAAEADGA